MERLWFHVHLLDSGVQACCRGGFGSWEHQRAKQIRRASQQGHIHHIPFSRDSCTQLHQCQIVSLKLLRRLNWITGTFMLKFFTKAFMVIMSHVPAYQWAFIFGLFAFDFLLWTQNSEEVSFLKVWFYLWVPVRWVVSVRQLKGWNTFFLILK